MGGNCWSREEKAFDAKDLGDLQAQGGSPGLRAEAPPFIPLNGSPPLRADAPEFTPGGRSPPMRADAPVFTPLSEASSPLLYGLDASAPAFYLDGGSPTQVALYDASDDMTAEDDTLTWTLPEAQPDTGAAPESATSPPFFIHGLAMDATRPPALSSPALELVYTPAGDGSADVTLRVMQKEKRKPRSVKVKFECILHGRSCGPKVCIGRKFTVSFPAVPAGPESLVFKILDIL